MSALLLIAVLSTASPIFQGAEQNKDDYDFPCKAGATSDFGVAVCQYQRYKKADAALNSEYRRILSTSTKKRRNFLIAAQRAWARFRDNDCLAIGSDWEGGHGRPGTEFACLADRTEQRTTQLRPYGR